MSALIEWLSEGPLITDGAWGTEFQKLGLPAGQSPDAWNLARPELVERVARSYIDVGSQIILTNTFQANGSALSSEVAEINRAGVAISKRAAAGKARVFGSIGPARRSASAFMQQADALAEAGVDALVIETMTDVDEARLAVRAAKRTGLPVIISFAFVTDYQPAQTARVMAQEGADAVGANCTGVEETATLCRALRSACDLPVWMKPSAGRPPHTSSPQEFATALLESGADMLGGCCGTSPEFIRALVEVRLNRR